MTISKLDTLRNGAADDAARIVGGAELINEELRAALRNALDRISVLEHFLDEFQRTAWEAMSSV